MHLIEFQTAVADCNEVDVAVNLVILSLLSQMLLYDLRRFMALDFVKDHDFHLDDSKALRFVFYKLFYNIGR